MVLQLADKHTIPNGWTVIGLGEFRNKKSISFNPQNETERKLELYSVPSHSTHEPEILSNSDIGSNKQYVTTGDVLISKINPRLNRTWVVGNFTAHDKIASTEWVVFKKQNTISSAFLKYLLETVSVRDYLSHNASGVGGSLTRVKPILFDTIEIGLPPAAEQTRIVEKIEELFSELDKGVESLKTAQQQLKVYRQALLKQAFEGKLTEQWRKDNPDKMESAEQLLACVKAERGVRYQQQLDEWKQAVNAWEAAGKEVKKPTKPKQAKELPSLTADELAGVPALPEGWAWIKFGNLTDYVTSGSRGWKEYYSNSGATFIRAQNLKHDSLNLNDIAYVDLPETVEGKRSKVNTDDILITITGANVTKAGIVIEHLEEAYVSQHVALCRLVNTSRANFIHQYLISGTGGRKQLEKAAYGAGKPGLNLDNIYYLSVPVASEAESKIVIEYLQAQLSLLEKLEADLKINLKKSEALRQSILKKAFSGQLVAQDPNDEPASELLKRIRTERETAELAEKEAKAKAKKTAPKRKPKATKPTAA
ncbi:restriction endonuclease subunit S [Endozoicomonas sp. ONNA2]|uniref:restriction endonuclease subunit S n=1 Tax=Endozoicomonas sp. ONNA2 TaxID=2828741 RepID=UPI0021486730|nr:restriction endonuclease subunit S [Endozoicomonas sp. ONNA2]